MGWIIGLGNGVFFRTGSSMAWSSYWKTRKPTGFSLENISETEINVLWINGSQLPDGVRIYISTDGVTFSVKGEVTDGYEGFVANGLTYGTTYYFYIVGYKDTTESDVSATLSLRAQTVGEAVLRDGNSLAWWDSSDVSTITKDAETGEVSAWASKLLASILYGGGAGKLPIYDAEGLLFDGVDDYMVATLAVNQPCTYYIVFKQVTWTLNDNIIDGTNGTHRLRLYQNDTTPRLVMYAGAVANYNGNLPIDTWGIIKLVFNGENSYSRVLRLPIVGVANVGTHTELTAIRLGANFNGGSPSNIKVKELIIRNGIDSYQDDSYLYSYLQNKHGFTSSLFDNGKLVITTDDFSKNVYTDVHPLLVAQGVKATHYVYGEMITAYNRWSQLQELVAAGMDIQCHTYSHARLSTLTNDEIITELNANTAAFVANSIPAPVHLAYTFGEVGNIQTVSSLRSSGRTISAGFIYKDTNKYLLPAKAIDGIDAAGIIALKAKLDIAQANKYGYCIYLHGLNTTGMVTSAQLNEIIDYAQGIGMDIITVSELYALMD